MRNSGLPVGRKLDIPFGVRAIQSGIEVDGIWISRPGTPIDSESPVTAATPLVTGGIEYKGKERATGMQGGVRSQAFEVQPTPSQTPLASPTPSVIERYNPTDGTHAAPTHNQQQTYRPRHAPQRPSDLAMNSATPARGQNLETYVPTTSYTMDQSSHQRSPVDQHHSHPVVRHHVRSFSQPRRGSNEYKDSESSSPIDYQPRGGYASVGGRETRGNPFESGESDRAPSRDSHIAAHRQNQSYGSTDSQITPPTRSYSGDTHANTSSRRVNAGFEVLPAGTFSRSNSQNDLESDVPTRSHNRMSSGANKLQKKGRDRSSSRD
jgi:hypothetical protein